MICALLMLALVFGMAFIPDNTKDFGINLQRDGSRLHRRQRGRGGAQMPGGRRRRMRSRRAE